MHPVEAAWRKFRNSEHRDLFERSLRLRQSFLDSIGLKRCPPEAVLPLAVPWNLAALAESQKSGNPIGPVLMIPRPEGDQCYVATVYDLLTGEEHSGALELRISEFMKGAPMVGPDLCPSSQPRSPGRASMPPRPKRSVTVPRLARPRGCGATSSPA